MFTCDGAGCAVGTRHRHRVGVGDTRLELVMRGVCRVSPAAVGIDRELAVAVAARHVGQCNKARRAVHVGDTQRAAGGQYRVGLGQIDHRRRDHRRVVGPQDVHLDGAGCAVGTRHRHRVGVGDTRLELVMRGVCRVSPAAVGIDRELAVAVAARHVGQCNKARRAVHVGDTQRAAGGQYRVGLGQIDHRRRDHRRVVGPQDVHLDGAGCAVGTRHRHRVGVGDTRLELVMRGVCRVSPAAVGIDRELAVAVAARHVGQCNKARRAVHVGDTQRAAGGQYRVGLGQIDHRRRDHRRVVGPQDVHLDGAGCAVGTRHRHRVGVGDTRLELVMRGVCRVSPAAVGIDRELAVTVAARHVGQCNKARRAVHVGDTQRAAGGQYRVGLGQIDHRRRDHRRVVGPQDVHL